MHSSSHLRFNLFALSVFVTLVFFSGLLKNVTGVQYRSLFVDAPFLAIASMAFFSALLTTRNRKGIAPLLRWYLLLVTAGVVVLLLGHNSLAERVLGFKNVILYLGLWLCVFYLTSEERDALHLSRLAGKLLIGFCLFGIVQSILGRRLPGFLLLVNGVSDLGFFQSDVFRPTALIGNSLEYGGMTLLAFSFWYCRWLFCSMRARTFCAAALCALAVWGSYSRMAIVSMVFVVGLSHSIYYLKYRRVGKVGLGVIFGGALALAIVALSGKSMILGRFFSSDVNTVQSNALHSLQFLAAIGTIANHPLAGVGVGSQGVSGRGDKIITDGFVWQMMLEYGVICSAVYFAFIASFVKTLVRKSRALEGSSLALVSSTSVMIVVMHITAFLNSSCVSVVNFSTMWLLAGLSLVVAAPVDPVPDGRTERGSLPDQESLAVRLSNLAARPR